ncbi:hypothetical protein K502DRAFT_162218 [Neoconidiobolus thromboides FSU 785]|nr:hypothetical protein K502DRAFT_162218 [Neoconidiobolus thromboides FSU 785]
MSSPQKIAEPETKELNSPKPTNDEEIEVKDTVNENSTSTMDSSAYTLLEDDSLLPWKTCWDNNYQCYYYWNTETNETSYELPIMNRNTIDPTAAVAAIAEETDLATQSAINSIEYNYYLSQENPNHPSLSTSSQYVATAHFNSKSGKFQPDPSLQPENFSYENKSLRQCSAFFDYNGFMQQRGAELQGQMLSGKKTKMTKKIVDKLKERRKEKKLAAKKKWLLED